MLPACGTAGGGTESRWSSYGELVGLEGEQRQTAVAQGQQRHFHMRPYSYIQVCPYDKADVVPISALKHAVAMAGECLLKVQEGGQVSSCVLFKVFHFMVPAFT